MPNENGNLFTKENERELCTALNSGSSRPSGLEVMGNIFLTQALSSIKSDTKTNPGAERLRSTPSQLENAVVKPLYLQFVRERDSGELPRGMRWDDYQQEQARKAQSV